MIKKCVISAVFLIATLYGDEEICVIPATPSPESNTVCTHIIFPRPYENKRRTPINVQLRLVGFPLGCQTEGKRSRELYNDPEGQSLHVIIDNEPYFVCNQLFDEADEQHDKIISFHIPFTLKPGMHVIRVFPTRSFGESLKRKEAFAIVPFYFQDRKKSDALNANLSRPYLTYNEPQGRYPLRKDQPLLLDFLLSNCSLSPEGFKVRLSIDGKEIQKLTDPSPYYLYGVSPGKHTIKLELLDKNNQIVPGFFNVVERQVEIDHF